ncbi:MAG: hypothetical protein QW390_04235 [Candidatus Bathyarchaeia archaeon]
MHVLVRGDLQTRGRIIVAGPRTESFRAEADRLNQEHYERCYEEHFGKPANGNHTPNKRYIWFDREVTVGGDPGAAILDAEGNLVGLLFAGGTQNAPL